MQSVQTKGIMSISLYFGNKLLYSGPLMNSEHRPSSCLYIQRVTFSPKCSHSTMAEEGLSGVRQSGSVSHLRRLSLPTW